MQILVQSIIRYLVSSFTQTLDLSLVICFIVFLSFRTLVTRVLSVKITQLASLDLHSKDIDACVLLDSRENIVKRVLRILRIPIVPWLFPRKQTLMSLVGIWFMYFFFICFFLILRQILINAKHPLANATRRLRVITHTDHTCAHANLDLSETGIIVQVTVLVTKAFWFLLNSTTTFCLVGCLLMFILVTWQASF